MKIIDDYVEEMMYEDSATKLDDIAYAIRNEAFDAAIEAIEKEMNEPHPIPDIRIWYAGMFDAAKIIEELKEKK